MCVLLACLALSVIVGRATARAELPDPALGLNLGGLWGQSEASIHELDAASHTEYFKPHTPRHWFLSVQLGFEGKLARSGARVGFNHQSVAGVEEWYPSYQRTLVRVGPFLGPVLWRGTLRDIPLTAYAEAAFYIDKYIWGGTRHGSRVNLAPSLGVGMDASVWRGLSVGFYGGFGYSFDPDGRRKEDPPSPYTTGFFEGDVRLTMLYVFGAKRGAYPAE